MRIKLLCAALLAASAHWASAAETTWHFTYRGFTDESTGAFLADLELTGKFTAADGNADGVISKEELTELAVGGTGYISPDGGCEASGNPYFSCSVGRFSYALSGTLSFAVSYGGHGEFSGGWYGGATSGDSWGHGWYREFISEESVYLWDERTTFAISPVPEPGMAILLPAGIAVLAAAQRRRAKVRP